MNLRDYIIKNYQKEIGKQIPKILKSLLTNIFAEHINLNEFKKEFNLEECPYKMILEYVLEPNNAYEIAKYGYEHSQTKPDFIDHREISATDCYDYEQKNIYKKI